MKDGKSKILIIIGGLLLIISILVIILSYIENNNNNANNNTSNNGGNSIDNTLPEMNLEIIKLKDESIFFSIQKILNNYYYNLATKNSSKLYNMLDNDYINENKITKKNILEKLNNNYEDVSFIAKEIYFNDKSQTTYYFVNGYVHNATMNEEEYSYEDNVNYLIIVDINSEYVIKPISKNINLYNYADSYNLLNIDLKNNVYYQKIEVSEKNKLITYVNEFLNLLFYDTERAYNMLNDETKLKYNNFLDFKNQIINIYNNISTNIFAYSKREKEDYIEYFIKDHKQRDIKIIEYNIMDYKIGY